jgi:chloride channel 7
MDREKERMGLLRSVTFNGSSSRPATTTETLVTKVFGTATAPNQRVSESLDYEPVQNKIFYERMKAAKEKRHLFG